MNKSRELTDSTIIKAFLCESLIRVFVGILSSIIPAILLSFVYPLYYAYEMLVVSCGVFFVILCAFYANLEIRQFVREKLNLKFMKTNNEVNEEDTNCLSTFYFIFFVPFVLLQTTTPFLLFATFSISYLFVLILLFSEYMRPNRIRTDKKIVSRGSYEITAWDEWDGP